MLNTHRIIIAALFSACFLTTSAIAQNAAIVNGKSIPKAKLDKLVQQTNQVDSPEVREQARQMLITRELILQEADKRGVTQKESVQDQLDQARMGVLVAALFEDFIIREGVAEDELKSAYEQVKTQYAGKEYQVEHILVEKELDAKAIIAQLKAGGSFAEIAKAKSKDPGSASKGGDLGWVSEGALVPEFSQAMVKLNKGQTSDQPVKSQFGWHIIKVGDIREMKAPSLNEIQDELKKMITSDEAWQKAKFAELMKKLRSKAKIE